MAPEAVKSFVRLRTNIGSDGREFSDFDQVDVGDLGDFELKWDREKRSLFDAGVLKRLPAPNRELTFDDAEQLAAALRALRPNISISSADKSNRGFFLGRVFHHLRERYWRTKIV
jgi:hypothetical protein